VPGSPVMVSNGLCAMAVDKNNAFLFATTPVTETNPPPSTVHVFQLDSNSGALTEVSGSPFGKTNSSHDEDCSAAVVN
jgi:hypothetical protein